MNTQLLTLGLAIAGCTPRPTDDVEVPPPPSVPDAGAAEDSTGDDHGEVVCREGLVPCDGACVDVASSDVDCGACGHACKVPSTYGHCRNGECPPAWFCGGAGRGFRTCEDVCAAHGQACHDGPWDAAWGGCGGGYRLHYAESSLTALEACEGDVGSYNGIEATCTTAIDWSMRGGWNDVEPGAVACCCTQKAP